MPLPRKMPGSQKKIDNFFVPAQKRLCLGIEGSQAGNDSHESQPADRAIGATSINENPAEVVLDGEPSFTTDLDRTTSNSGACAPVETARRDDSPQDVPSLPPKGYKFPSNQTGRSCKYAWFQKFTWLSYDYERDVVFCTVCLIAFKERGGNVAGVEPCFIRAGFNNWKKAIEKFQCHEKSQFHCVSASRQLSREKGMHVVQLLSQHSSRQQEEARQALRAIVSSVRYLCRTGQALQGQTKDDGNLLDLLDERSQDVPALKRWMEQRDRWLSSDIQNELIEIMAHSVQRGIIRDVRCIPFYGIIADGTTDVTGNEQFTFCVRWVDGITLEVREEFLGMYNAPDSRAETLYRAVKDMILRLGLDFHNLRGHCFDGAANMAGRFTGVQKRIMDSEPRSIFVHCSNDCLDLALQEVARNCEVVGDALNIVKDVSHAILESKTGRLFILTLSFLRVMMPMSRIVPGRTLCYHCVQRGGQ